MIKTIGMEPLSFNPKLFKILARHDMGNRRSDQ